MSLDAGYCLSDSPSFVTKIPIFSTLVARLFNFVLTISIHTSNALKSMRNLRRKQLFRHDFRDKLYYCHKTCHGNQHFSHVDGEQSKSKVTCTLDPVDAEIQRGDAELAQGPVVGLHLCTVDPFTELVYSGLLPWQLNTGGT